MCKLLESFCSVGQPFRTPLIVLIKIQSCQVCSLVTFTVSIALALEEEKHSCPSGFKCPSFCKGSFHVWLSVAWWSFNWFKGLTSVRSGAFRPPICCFPSFPPVLQKKKKKNHLISSGQCSCSLKWVTESTLVPLYSLALQGAITPKTNFSSPHWSLGVEEKSQPHFQADFFYLLLFRQLCGFTLWFLPFKKEKTEM